MNNEFRVDNISDAGRMYNFACTKIMFKYYLEDNNMKVCESQVIINDLYQSFVNDIASNKPKTKQSVNKLRSRKVNLNVVGGMKQIMKISIQINCGY